MIEFLLKSLASPFQFAPLALLAEQRYVLNIGFSIDQSDFSETHVS